MAMPEKPGTSQKKERDRITRLMARILADPDPFSRHVMRRPLREYQLEVARAVLQSVVNNSGHTFAVMMSRQAGKNETAAQIEAQLLNVFCRAGGQIVKASPTFKPQTINSILRLEKCLDNPWNAGAWRRRGGYIMELGKARALFFSAEPGANVVGATADVLLEADEAQDIEPGKWHKDFSPMAASTNATRVMWGTAWTSDTLLARTIAHLRELERSDGVKRVFTVPWERVAEEVPGYGRHVQAEIARLGERHPLVRTQYMLEEIDGEAGMFPPHRAAQMHGEHQRTREPVPGRRYALLVDVAGEEHSESALPTRDSTALTVVEIDTSTLRDPLLARPTYRAVDRRAWRGTPHASLFASIADLVARWRAAFVVVDATGIGHGLAGFLAARFGAYRENDPSAGGKVIPFVFSQGSKSRLGYDFIAMCDTGRYKEYAPDDAPDTALFWQQVRACRCEILPGPGRVMRWSVPDPVLHDDYVVSAALAAALDDAVRCWPSPVGSAVIDGQDALEEIDRAGW